MKYLIVGFGSIGKRHADNIRTIDPDAEITLWHTRAGHAIRPDGITREVFCCDDALASQPDIAVIASPASTHIPFAQGLAREGIDLFLEKPVSSTMDGIPELLDIQKRSGIIIAVGYNFRFHTPLRMVRQCISVGCIGRLIGIRAEVGQYLPDWRPGMDYRQSVSAQKALGGGAVLELSHEIDYVRWLAGEISSVMSLSGCISDLEMDVEDSAEIIVNFSSGALGNIHLDMVQRVPSRSCKVIGTGGTVVWDGASDSVMLYTAESPEGIMVYPPKKIDRNQMYHAEMEHFISCCRNRTEPAVPLSEGVRVLEVALAALKSSQEKRCIAL